jgi:WS/DGAT/MGAT family acyltransferase
MRRVPATARDATTAAMRDPIGSGAGVWRTVASVGRALAPATVPMSPVMRNRGLGRQLDLFDLPLDDVRRAAKETDGSVNDVFVAAVVGGLQRYHARHGDAPDALRMTLPINLRREGDDAAGNHWAPARFAVPASIADPRERVQAIRALVRRQRAEPFLQLTGPLAGMLNRLPTATTTAIFGGMLKCCDFVATNVQGAPVPVFAGGAKVERLYAFAPPAGAAVNVSLISHCDTCCIGIVTDTTAVPDPGALVECIREGFDELLSLS